MAKKKVWGSIRKVLLELASGFVQVNEDLEMVSIQKVREAMKRGGDLLPRVYYYPEAELTFTARAIRQDGKIKIFSGEAEQDESTIQVTVRTPIVTRPLNVDEIEKIAAMKEEDITAKLLSRKLRDIDEDFYVKED